MNAIASEDIDTAIVAVNREIDLEFAPRAAHEIKQVGTDIDIAAGMVVLRQRGLIRT